MAETASKQSLNSVTPEQDATSEIIESSPSASAVDTSPYQASIPIESETNNVSQTKPTGTDNSTIENNEATSSEPTGTDNSTIENNEATSSEPTGTDNLPIENNEATSSEPTGTDNLTIENNEATSSEPTGTDNSTIENNEATSSEPTGTDNSTIENNEATSSEPTGTDNSTIENNEATSSEPTGTDNSTIENNEATSSEPTGTDNLPIENNEATSSEPTGTDNSTIENNEATSSEPTGTDNSTIENNEATSSEPTGTDNLPIENNEATSLEPSNVVEPEQHATSDSKTIASLVTQNPLIIRDSTISPQNSDAIKSEPQIEFPIKSTEPTTADLHQSIEEKEASVSKPPVLSSTAADPPVVTDTKTSTPAFASPHSRTPPNTPSAEPAGNTYTFDNSQRTQKGYQKATPTTTENISSPKQKRKRHGSGIASSSTPGRSNKFQTLYSAIPILICAAIALVISILEIIFGIRYHNQCSANPNIPTHLYLAGIITIFTTALSIVTSVALSVIPLKEIKNSKELTIMVKILRIILVVTHVLLILFLFSLFRDALNILKTIQYDRMEESKTFCNKKLHRFTGIICIVHIIDAVILCCFVFRIRNKQ
ncbi:hypothetical protein I4U23_011497 [Adineta vaga]|nr:hypothetical protein I4U23_011497 [Adineta vaga]